MIFDPPNLSKSSTKSDSRAKVTKGLFIFLPKHGRMQKFTTFYQAGFENVQNFSIFTCMFSSGWGPYPNLKVLLCEKMHDHLGGRRGPLVRSFVSGQAFVLLLMSHFLSFVWCLICLTSGSALRALSEIAVYSQSSINISLVLCWSSQRPVLVSGL